MKLMLSPRYDESSYQSYGLLYHLIGPAYNCKSLNGSGRSPFFDKISSFFEVFLPMNPIQTFIKRLVTKANISYYCWTLIGSNQGWKKGLRTEGEGGKYRETQVSWTGATCHTYVRPNPPLRGWEELGVPQKDPKRTQRKALEGPQEGLRG